MSQKMTRKNRLGKREKELLRELEREGGMARYWKADKPFPYDMTRSYVPYASKRIKRLIEKGYLRVETIVDPETKRKKKYLVLVRRI